MCVGVGYAVASTAASIAWAVLSRRLLDRAVSTCNAGLREAGARIAVPFVEMELLTC